MEIIGEHVNLSGDLKGSLRMSLQELMTNVVDHSGTQNYYVCAWTYPRKKQLRLCIADLGIGIFINEYGNYELTANKDKAKYPSGALFKISRSAWKDIGGFNEEFINGGEDQDLFLRCIEADYSCGFVDTPVVHYCSQSTGRFDYISENDKLLFSLWPENRLNKVLGNDHRQPSDVVKL